MSDIQDLLALLRSDNHNKRFDACEQLRVWRQPLPQDAIDALAMATNDVNADVADAAKRALSLHNIIDNEEEHKQESDETTANTVKNWLPIGLLAGLIPGLVLYIWIVLIVNNDIVYPILLGLPGIPCGIIGASWGRQSRPMAWSRAILVAILGVGVWFGIAMATCLFCM